MKKFLFSSAAAALFAFSGSAMAAQFVAGKDYTVLPNPVAVEKPGKIEVREFFWYGCPHCFTLEPHMQAWLKQMPKDVRFVRTPASMNPLWEQGARAYYVSEALGVRQKTHLPLFHAIHANGQNILEQASFAKFFTQFGIPEAKFNSTYKSFPISSKIAQSQDLAKRYQLTGVPAVTVNGKYVIQGEDGKVTQVLNYLIEQERKAK
ncbi:thiol:disulfide interchange protein DsbA/DsbL [Acinetobacter sp. WCHAc010034]|jgi:thiol:disulfide interchange protein DsbA|uniref:thiol:disulfide interchange protein DsbA/DsbL n=1 Tax=Acinetobacter sp. WCHAc010034 TaxID=1879049 RepID=UPI00083AFC72|nr:thiol:disulfide interchange protein DsbA/DsbL [Acinetobacter sp. WCHAc010034]AYA03325.1 thiol:disulfide interchange protein DsbA/DsbL [Acinetobacter sp. WCHAc010034]MBL8322253.1 thiol:disulfide interchange protein DsbA/DsbL [Acinetobacter sp.]